MHIRTFVQPKTCPDILHRTCAGDKAAAALPLLSSACAGRASVPFIAACCSSCLDAAAGAALCMCMALR